MNNCSIEETGISDLSRSRAWIHGAVAPSVAVVADNYISEMIVTTLFILLMILLQLDAICQMFFSFHISYQGKVILKNLFQYWCSLFLLVLAVETNARKTLV